VLGLRKNGFDDRAHGLDDRLSVGVLHELVRDRQASELDRGEVRGRELGGGGRRVERVVEDGVHDRQHAAEQHAVLRVEHHGHHLGHQRLERDREGVGHKVDTLLERLEDEQLLVVKVRACS